MGRAVNDKWLWTESIGMVRMARFIATVDVAVDRLRRVLIEPWAVPFVELARDHVDVASK